MAQEKKSVTQIILGALNSLASYSATIATTRTLLELDDVKKNDSLRVTLEATIRMATENRDSEVSKIFRRAAEKVGNNPEAVRDFALAMWPALQPPKEVSVDTAVESKKQK